MLRIGKHSIVWCVFYCIRWKEDDKSLAQTDSDDDENDFGGDQDDDEL
jgi:hypothetical protein